MIKKLFLFLMICLFGCTTVLAARNFSQYKGKALELGIPIYQGMPPAKYPYQNLGIVTGEAKKELFDTAVESMFNALEYLANRAKALGANAIINVESHSKGFGNRFSYEGEAVIFERLPD